MRKVIAAVLVSAACVMLAGCFLDRRTPQPRLSIKDSAPIATGSLPAPTPAPKKDASIEERARAEHLKRCLQRHVDYQAGKLNETVEQKRLRDETCSELHRTDHARK